MAKIKKKTQVTVHVEKDVEQREPSSTAVKVQTSAATFEINMEISQKTRNQSPLRYSYTTLGNIPKRCSILPQGYLLNYIHRNFIINKYEETGNNLDVPQPKNG